MKKLPPLDKGLEYVYRVPTGTVVEADGILYRVGIHDGVWTILYSLSTGHAVRYGMFQVVELVAHNNNKKEKKKNAVQKLRLSANGSGSNKEKPRNR